MITIKAFIFASKNEFRHRHVSKVSALANVSKSLVTLIEMDSNDIMYDLLYSSLIVGDKNHSFKNTCYIMLLSISIRVPSDLLIFASADTLLTFLKCDETHF